MFQSFSWICYGIRFLPTITTYTGSYRSLRAWANVFMVDGIQEIDVLSLGRFGSLHEAVGVGLMVFQHFGGINGVPFYLSHVDCFHALRRIEPFQARTFFVSFLNQLSTVSPGLLPNLSASVREIQEKFRSSFSITYRIMSFKPGVKAKPLKQPKAQHKEYDETDLANLQKS
ncbi:hypothetical protein C5167_032412 [Papaver somniferum]|uniref:Uncharacterized protein n=1 Tax=Papaver somniferum TaxID=3469 RepID=A0A4Y7KBK1_PAPSO|nr:hypothetical protein C5167_032412 [Papaver somniferum]